ncbi:MAG: hypothetical protein EA424_22430 [Planctomycetaceae bacterium]|nr:MAG: hypothetical protein EA424_22430 [Planctomycetaceae bacterium]
MARTVIEQSFVNRTRGRLEGVFYFPLPQDASISGFGMWIDNELVTGGSRSSSCRSQVDGGQLAGIW